MKYCSKCGKELFDEAVICPGCGCPTETPAPAAPVAEKAPEKESSTLITIGMISAFLLPLVGLICGIVGNKKYTDPQLKQKSKSVIFLSLGMWVIYFFIFTVMGQL